MMTRAPSGRDALIAGGGAERWGRPGKGLDSPHEVTRPWPQGPAIPLSDAREQGKLVCKGSLHVCARLFTAAVRVTVQSRNNPGCPPLRLGHFPTILSCSSVQRDGPLRGRNSVDRCPCVLLAGGSQPPKAVCGLTVCLCCAGEGKALWTGQKPLVSGGGTGRELVSTETQRETDN